MRNEFRNIIYIGCLLANACSPKDTGTKPLHKPDDKCPWNQPIRSDEKVWEYAQTEEGVIPLFQTLDEGDFVYTGVSYPLLSGENVCVATKWEDNKYYVTFK